MPEHIVTAAGVRRVGEVLEALESKVNAKDVTRVRFDGPTLTGWASVTAGDGSILLKAGDWPTAAAKGGWFGLFGGGGGAPTKAVPAASKKAPPAGKKSAPAVADDTDSDSDEDPFSASDSSADSESESETEYSESAASEQSEVPRARPPARGKAGGGGGGQRYRVVEGALVRAGFEMSSRPVGQLLKGEGLLTLESRLTDARVQRVRFEGGRFSGWVSLKAGDGSTLLRADATAGLSDDEDSESGGSDESDGSEWSEATTQVSDEDTDGGTSEAGSAAAASSIGVEGEVERWLQEIRLAKCAEAFEDEGIGQSNHALNPYSPKLSCTQNIPLDCCLPVVEYMADVADLEEDDIDTLVEAMDDGLTRPEAKRLRREIHAIVAMQAAADSAEAASKPVREQPPSKTKRAAAAGADDVWAGKEMVVIDEAVARTGAPMSSMLVGKLQVGRAPAARTATTLAQLQRCAAHMHGCAVARRAVRLPVFGSERAWGDPDCL